MYECIVCMVVINVSHAQIIKPRASIVNRACKHVSESTPIQTIIKTMHELLNPADFEGSLDLSLWFSLTNFIDFFCRLQYEDFNASVCFTVILPGRICCMSRDGWTLNWLPRH